MEGNEYLQTILAAQSLFDDSDEVKALVEERQNVESLLRQKYGRAPSIKPGGSWAKGTMIRESYDLDLICYFNHEDKTPGESLKNIYDDVRKCVEAQYVVQTKTSALRLMSRKDRLDFHIDVVPGRFISGSEGDVYLHQTAGSEDLLKTNLDVHISHIKNSGLTDEIKLAKLWNVLSGLRLKTFVLELLVIKVMRGSRAKTLADRLTAFWQETRDNGDRLAIEDPANPNGNDDLRDAFNLTIKRRLASVADSTITSVNVSGWESVFGPADEPSDEAKIGAIQDLASRRTASPKLWRPHA